MFYFCFFFSINLHNFNILWLSRIVWEDAGVKNNRISILFRMENFNPGRDGTFIGLSTVSEWNALCVRSKKYPFIRLKSTPLRVCVHCCWLQDDSPITCKARADGRLNGEAYHAWTPIYTHGEMYNIQSSELKQHKYLYSPKSFDKFQPTK